MNKRESVRLPFPLEVQYLVQPAMAHAGTITAQPSQKETDWLEILESFNIVEPPDVKISGPAARRGWLEDLGQNGCRLRSEQGLEERQLLKIRFPMGERTNLSVPTLAEVRWVKAAHSDQTSDQPPHLSEAATRPEPAGTPATSLFARLTPGEWTDIVKRLQPPKAYAPGTAIVNEGMESTYSLYLIARGMAKVTTKRNGQEFVLGGLKEGDFFGEASFLTKKRRMATVTALFETEILELQEADLVEVIERHPHVGEVLKAYHVARLQQNTEQFPLCVAGCRFLF